MTAHGSQLLAAPGCGHLLGEKEPVPNPLLGPHPWPASTRAASIGNIAGLRRVGSRQIAEMIPKDAQSAKAYARMFEDVGVDELVYDPVIADPKEVERLAEAVL